MDYSQILMNPLFLGALQAQGNPIGKALMEQSMAARENEFKKAQIDKYRFEQEEELRKREMEQKISSALQSVDTSDPQRAIIQLGQMGITGKAAQDTLKFIMESKNDLRRLGFEEQRVGFDRERLGLDRARLGIEQGNLSLRAQELQQKLANGGLSREDQVKIEKELRSEVAKESGEFKTIKSAYEKVKAAASNPSPANDIALLYGIMKVYDPGSVVRESEYATAEKTVGVPDVIRNAYNRALSGQRLNDSQRKDFVNSAKQIYKTQVTNIKNVGDKYKGLAKDYGVEPNRVVLFEPDESEFQPQPVELKQPSMSREQQIIEQLKAQGFTDEQIAKIR